MYVGKCHKFTNKENEAYTGQVISTKTKAYHMYSLNRQFSKILSLHFIPQS